MKIVHKLLLTVLVAALLPLVGAGLAVLITTQNALRTQIQTRIDNTSQHQLGRLAIVNKAVQVRLSNVQFKTQLRLLLKQYNAVPSPKLQSDLNTALSDIVASEATFHRMYITNDAGRIIASTDATIIGKDYSRNEAFLAGSKAPTIDHFFRTSDDEIDQYLAAPMQLEGTILGVAIVEATAAPYLAITKDYAELGVSGESYLVRERAHGAFVYLTPLRFRSDAALTNAGANAVPTVDYRKHSVLGSALNVPGTDWKLVAKVDTAEVDAPLVRTRQILLFVLVLTATLASICAWYLSRYMTRPIKRLTEVVIKIREGDLSQRVEVHSNDELGVLGTAFNEMKTSLLESRARLEASIGSLPFGFAIINRQDEIVFRNESLDAFAGDIVSSVATTPANMLAKLTEKYKSVINLSESIHKTQQQEQIIEQYIEVGPKFFRLLFVPVINKIATTDRVVGSVMMVEDTSEKMAMERSRDEFFSIASHELRTPLTAIKGNASLLRMMYAEQFKDPELNQMVQDIEDSGGRLLHIVNDFLDMSSLEQGHMVFNAAPFDMAELVPKVLQEYDATGSQRKVALLFEPADAPAPLVMADADRTRQIIVNLLGNAIKATQDGSITIAATVQAAKMLLRVTDTGKGIPASAQHLLFRKFQQAETSTLTRDSSQSTGLGLYISRLFAEGMGGKLYLDKSEPGKGTTFILELPIATGPQTPAS